MSDLSPRGNLAVSFGEVCDRGTVREENQDSILSASIPIGKLFIVADGIGGYQGGATASKMVIREFQGQLANRPPGYPAEDALIEACTYANASIYNEANSGNPSLQRMGSTVVLALIQSGATAGGNSGEVASLGPVAWIGHVGDSRAYLIRGGQMIRQTNDHSAVQALLNRNLITEEEARNHPDASVLTRSLGHRPQVEIEINRVSLQEGDALLLCSDGLWGYVADADIAAVAKDPGLSVQTTADTLLRLALAAGGHDNIGIEFIRIGNSAAPSLGAPAAASAPMRATAYEAARPVASAAVMGRADRESSGRKRTLEMLAVGLLLLGGCGYLGIAAYTHSWPFPAKNPRSMFDPRLDGEDGGSGGQGSGSKTHPGAGHATSKDSELDHTNPVDDGDANGSRQIGIVGQIRIGSYVPPDPGEIEWRYATIRHDTQPACVELAKENPVVYADKSRVKGRDAEIVSGIVKQYPDLKGPLDRPQVEHHEMTDEIRNACGKDFDVIVLLPVQNSPVQPAPPATTNPPTGTRATDSQDHSQPVVQRPRQTRPQ